MSLSDKTIAVMMGGPGNEREVSIASGKSVSQALSEKGATVLDLCIEDKNFTLEDEVDLVFNVIHGTFGEPHDVDGVVQINADQRDSGQFIEGLTLKAEKEM